MREHAEKYNNVQTLEMQNISALLAFTFWLRRHFCRIRARKSSIHSSRIFRNGLCVARDTQHRLASRAGKGRYKRNARKRGRRSGCGRESCVSSSRTTRGVTPFDDQCAPPRAHTWLHSVVARRHRRRGQIATARVAAAATTTGEHGVKNEREDHRAATNLSAFIFVRSRSPASSLSPSRAQLFNFSSGVPPTTRAGYIRSSKFFLQHG